MNTKFVAAVLLAGLGIYLLLFSRCKEDPFHIVCRLRPAPRGAKVERGAPPMYDVSFTFNKRYPLKSFKVVAAQELATNKYPLALWHLVAESKPVPVKAIIYGKPVRGMKPVVAELEPEPLQPNTEYVVLVETDDVQARTNFIARQRVLQKN
jgi:hypothetical protein